MIAKDTAFGTLAKAPIKQTNVVVVRQTQDPYGYHDDTTAMWTSSSLLMSVAIDAVGQFLGTTTKKATVKLLGIITTANAGDTFQIRLGLYNSDPSVVGYDYISEGFYVIDNVSYDYDAGSTTVTMYDYMWGASNTPYATGFTYPATVAQLAQQVASAIGANLMTGFGSLPNASYNILVDLYANISNATMQTVIQEIAATTGTTARISDTTLVFDTFNIDPEVLDSSVLKNLTVGDNYGPVTSVILGRVPQNDNVVLSNTTPTANTITSVNTTTELFTITGNSMTDGTLVQIQSTGTVPAPLVAGTNYFVYTGGSANTFKLMATYANAIAGTSPINLTTAGTGTITLTQLQNQEVQLNNVQIMDNDRTTMLPPLYSALLGIGWTATKSNTIGLPWHEVGDVINFQQGSVIVPSFLSEVHLTLAGSIQENLVSVIPDAQTINYQTAGGILKTIYDTEIKVDKQNNDIESIVSQQIVYANQTLENFSEVTQQIDNVTTQIQSVGGGNLILNSVGYAKETNGTLSFWTTSGTGSVTSYSSAVSLSAGGTSGNSIDLVGSSASITQRVSVANTAQYSVGFRVNKTAANGSAKLVLSNTVTSFEIDILSGTGYAWQELSLENIVPGQNYWDVTLTVTGSTTGIEITDLRIVTGPILVEWTQSQSEILNSQVALTTAGIRVSSNVHPGDYTLMTPIEFSGWSDATSPGTSKKVFWVNRDTTEVANLQVDGTANFANVIRAISTPSGSLAGLSFVGAVS